MTQPNDSQSHFIADTASQRHVGLMLEEESANGSELIDDHCESYRKLHQELRVHLPFVEDNELVVLLPAPISDA